MSTCRDIYFILTKVGASFCSSISFSTVNFLIYRFIGLNLILKDSQSLTLDVCFHRYMIFQPFQR